MNKNSLAAPHAEPWTRGFLITAVLIVLATAGLRFFQIGSFSFWDDELYSIATATQPHNWYNSTGGGKGLAELQATDGFWVWKLSDPHPPLYEMLLSIWISVFGTSELAVRSLSAVFGVLAVVSAFALPAVIPRGARILYAILMMFSGPLLTYSQDARNYVMGICMVAWMFVLALQQWVDDYPGIQAGRPRKGLLVLAALLMLTHFYGVVVVFSFAAVVTLQARGWRNFFSASVRWSLTLVPLAVYVFFGWKGIFNKVGGGPEEALSFAMAFKRNTVDLLHNFYPTTHANSAEFWALFFFLILVTWAFMATQRSQKSDLLFSIKMIAAVQLVIFLIMIFSSWRAGIFSSRYLVFLIPGSLLLVSTVTFVTRWTRWLGAIVAVSLVAGGLRLWHQSPRPKNDNEWRDASALVAENFRQGDLIVAVLAGPWMLEYYGHYLRKDIPAKNLENAVVAAFRPETLEGQLAEKMRSQPPKIILFSYVGLQGLEDLVAKTVTARWPCQLGQWEVMGNIRVGTMRCSYP